MDRSVQTAEIQKAEHLSPELELSDGRTGRWVGAGSALSASVPDGAFKPLLCFLTRRSATLADYVDEGQKLLLVLIRHFA